MIKKYRYTINLSKSDELNQSELHVISGESLIELLSKLLIVIVQMENGEYEKLLREIQSNNDDDIPF
jgi:hypothetical protein